MALTRGSGGITAPRKPYTPAVETTTTRKTKTNTTTKKATGSGVGRPKANTSKPRAKATTEGRVEQKKLDTKKNASVGDRVKGAVEKTVGIVDNKPGKNL